MTFSAPMWTLRAILSQWTRAAIKKAQQQKTKRVCVSKKSALWPHASPSNFWPLTSCSSKLSITILWNRWLSYMTSNGYLDPSIQKAFMSTTSGCVEHHLKLAAILAEAKKQHKSALVSSAELLMFFSLDSLPESSLQTGLYSHCRLQG